MSNETEDVDDGPFTPSPYPLSILPRIHHVKSRPSRTEKSDLPPTPSRDIYHRERGAIVVEAESSQRYGISEIGLGSAVASHDPKRQFANESKINGQSVDSMENSTRSSYSRQRSLTSAPLDHRKSTSHFKKIEVIEVTDHATHARSTKQVDNPIISDHSTNEEIICQICNKNIARYTCPKCHTLYCSVACYRQHNGGAEIDNYGRQITDSEGRGGFCTESFYKDRVLSEYKSLKSEVDVAKLRGILARMHRDINDGLDNLELQEESLSKMLREGEESSNFSSSIASDLNHRADRTSLQLSKGNSSGTEISDEDLAELAAYVLQMEVDDPGSVNNGAENEEDSKSIIDCIPPHLLYAFECALASASALPDNNNHGELESAWKPFLQNDPSMPEINDLSEKETIGQSPKEQKTITSSKKRQEGRALSPWWMPFEEKICSTDEDTRNESPTLDERILSLRALPKLHHGTAPNLSLAYNIVEVLYSTAFSIRATKPLSSKIDDEEGTSIYQAALLLSHSSVLSKDARYESVGNALSSSSEQLINLLRTIPKENMNNSQLSWESLTSDVAKLSQNRRYVLRILFDASDICDVAIVHIKKNMKTKRSEDFYSMKKEYEESKKSYKLALKKIEYFQSWSSKLWTVELGRTISDEAYAFIDDWKRPDINTAAETPIETFLRHVNCDEATKEEGEKRERDTTFSLGSDFFRLDLGHDDNLMKNCMTSISTTRQKKAV